MGRERLYWGVVGRWSHASVPRDLKIATYNVNYGRAGHPRTLAAIRGLDADCLFLQETTPAWERALRRELVRSYAHMEFRHWRPGRAGGHGLLARHPIVAEQVLDAPTGWFPAWRVVVATPRGPLQVLAVHLRPFFSVASGFHKSFFATDAVRRLEIATYLGRLDRALPTVILGDFNETEGQAMAHVRAEGYRQAPARTHTWRFLRWTRTYDHIFHGPGVAVDEVVVVPAGASDHLPLVASLVLRS
jgi:endonuclease/exonuclease/phosphatase family metal-dependent hydrolase